MLRHRIALLAFVTVCSFTMTACDNGGDNDHDSASGTAAFAMTDTPSEQVASMQIDIADIQLRRTDGTMIDVLDAPVRVDLASLRDVSQLIDLSTLPSGSYPGMDVTFDFTNARMMLANQSTAATLLDAQGAPLTGTHTVSVTFADDPITVAGSHHHLVVLDIPLDQSAIVDAAGNSASIEPMFGVTVDNNVTKDSLAAGRLQSFDSSSRTFVVRMETLNGTPLSDVTFRGGVPTVYQVDGVPLTGDPGFAAMTGMPTGTWVEARGRLIGGNFEASNVTANQGTFGGGQDFVDGVIVDRTGGAGADATFTVIGNSSDATHTNTQFGSTFTVDSSFANTRVVREGSPMTFDVDDLNVGQKVHMFGQLNGSALDLTSGGIVRAMPTSVFGFASGASSGGTLTMDIDRIEQLDESNFNWSGSGTTPPSSNAMTMQIGALDTGMGIASGSAVSSSGFFSPVDDGLQDFSSSSLSNLDTAPVLLGVHDLDQGFTVDTTTTATGIMFGITGTPTTGEFANIDQTFLGTTPLLASPTPTVAPATTGHGSFFLKNSTTGQATLFSDFSGFSSELGTQLGSGATMSFFGANGAFDSPTNAMTATNISASIQ